MTAMPLTAPAAASAIASTAALADARVITVAAGCLAGAVRDAAGWPADDRRGLLRQLDRAMDALAAVRAAVLLAERESGAWQGGGDRSFQAWRARTSLAGERAAAAQVRQAEHLAAVPSVAAAVADGRIGLEHAATIGRVVATGSPAQRAAVTRPDAQAHLLQLAREQDAGTFATTVAGVVAGADPDGLERDHQAQRRARFVHLADTPRGTVIKGQLDSMAGRRLRLAFEALTPRPGADDDRDPGQLRADALDTMAGRVLSDGDTKPGAHVPPHVSIILTEATWHAARAERDRRRRAAVTADSPAIAVLAADQAPRGGHEPAALEDGTPVPPTELAVAMCDCEVTRIVIDAQGAPLDLGRSQRLFTGAQRRAVIARDRECAWPSCHAPARWGEVHHIRWWDRDHGPTSVENAVLLCSFHHHEVHRRDLTITRLNHPPGSDRPSGGDPRSGSGQSPGGDQRSGSGQSPGGASRSGSDHRPGSARSPSRVAGTLTHVRYEFRDPTGRLVGEPPAARSGREPPGEPTLAWSTDPVTGMRVPALFLGPVLP